MSKRKRKTGYELFRHQLVTFIVMLCIFALSAGWYLTTPTTARCALMLALGVLGPAFPSDTRPEMTDRDSEFLYWFIFFTQWTLSGTSFLLSNLLSTSLAFVFGFVLYRNRHSLQLWLHDHPPDQFVFKKDSWMMLFWCSTVLVFGGTVGLISGSVNRIFCITQLSTAVIFVTFGAVRVSYRLSFEDDHLMETHLLKKRQIPYEEVSHCKIGGLFSQKIIGKNGKTLVKIRFSTVGPMARLIRTFGKRPQF